MPAGHGVRARTRDSFSRAFRQKGYIPLSVYLRTYKLGDYVDVKVNAAVHKVICHLLSVVLLLLVLRTCFPLVRHQHIKRHETLSLRNSRCPGQVELGSQSRHALMPETAKILVTLGWSHPPHLGFPISRCLVGLFLSLSPSPSLVLRPSRYLPSPTLYLCVQLRQLSIPAQVPPSCISLAVLLLHATCICASMSLLLPPPRSFSVFSLLSPPASVAVFLCFISLRCRVWVAGDAAQVLPGTDRRRVECDQASHRR